MQILILDGSHPGDPMPTALTTALMTHVRTRGWHAETVVLDEAKIGNCAGDFFCWIRTPGVCNTDDDNRIIAAKMARSDLIVYLTPVTFGGYSSTLKRMLDHQIQNIEPFFTTIDGVTHHQARYPTNPNLLILGWTPATDHPAEAVFRHLARANATNMQAHTVVSDVITGHPDPQHLLARAERWLDAIASQTSSPVPPLPRSLPPASPFSNPSTPPRSATLLVGSPRTGTSTSGALGGYLMDQLQARGVQTTTVQIYTRFTSATRRPAALEALDNSDLIVLAFPLYIDSLPAPVISALEAIATHRTDRAKATRFAAIANCGFPEARHNDTALAICQQFARQAGYDDAGGLALGAGEGLVHGKPLTQSAGPTTRIKQALDLSATALAAGQPIPAEATTLMARPVIPHQLYRLIGHIGWNRQAKTYGMRNELHRQPYQATPPPTHKAATRS